MIESQLTEIRNYLLSKKLPIDILIEVNDHFVSQINDLQREENLDFAEAFEKTKLKWDYEFILVRKNFFTSKKIPKIIYDINRIQNINTFKKSFYIVISYMILQFCLAKLLNEDFYISVISIAFIIISIYPIRMILLYIKQQKLLFENRRKNATVNNFLHPLLSFAIGFSIDQMMHFPKNTKHLIYDFANFGADEKVSTEMFFINIFFGIIILSFYVYAFLSLENNVKKLEKINKFAF
jgi:hypothetical protein